MLAGQDVRSIDVEDIERDAGNKGEILAATLVIMFEMID